MKTITSYLFKFLLIWLLLLFLTSIFSLIYNFFINPNRVYIGFPFRFYESFQVSGNPYKNSGWHVKNFVLDSTIYLFVSITLNFYIIKMVRKKE